MKKILFILPCVLFFSCGNKKTELSDFDWLKGKWVGTSDGMEFYEQWEIVNENLMDGKGGAISGKDTVFSEKIKIEQRESDLLYIPDVKENNGPVEFKFTGYKNDSIVFENPTHDFPQRIIYFRLSNNKLYACIDGLNKGRYLRTEFSYKKAE